MHLPQKVKRPKPTRSAAQPSGPICKRRGRRCRPLRGYNRVLPPSYPPCADPLRVVWTSWVPMPDPCLVTRPRGSIRVRSTGSQSTPLVEGGRTSLWLTTRSYCNTQPPGQMRSDPLTSVVEDMTVSHHTHSTCTFDAKDSRIETARLRQSGPPEVSPYGDRMSP
jgi:hypothetical protein